MPREYYQSQLDALRGAVVDLGDTVLGQLDDGLEALETGDEPLARRVIEGDEPINERYLALEAECIDLFALQQPVAGDLRFIASSFKIVTDLERVGDLATNLGRYALGDSSDPPDVDIVKIGWDARAMVADALAAYESTDVDRCFEIERRDDEVDILCQHVSEAIVRDLIERETGTNAWALERLLDDVSRLLLTIRDVERIGDHAVNIAARTLYMAEQDTGLLY